MKKILFLIAMTAIALVSCRRMELEDSAVSDKGDGTICFSSYNQNTKASVATIKTLKKNGFGVWASENEADDEGEPTTWNPSVEPSFFTWPKPQEVEYSTIEGGWVYEPLKYWSDDDRVTMNFIAFSPYDETKVFNVGADDSSPITFGPFDIAEDIDDQEDYLVATKFDLPQVQKVILEFQHVLSRIGFSAYAPSLASNETIQITDIQLRDASDSSYVASPTPFFYNSGYVKIPNELGSSGSYLRNPKWDITSKDKLAFELGSNDLVDNGYISDAPARLNLEDKYIMVIPQNNMSGMEIYVKYIMGIMDEKDSTWTYTEKEKEFSCPVTSFNVNTAYTFNFKLGVNEVSFDCSVADWEENVYSLNASGDVYAQSSLDGCNVYVDAQRKVVDNETVTDYTLYAEMKTIVEDGVETNMLPIWKLAWKKAISGYVEVGQLLNIYLDMVDGIALNETTLGEDTKYTTLSFRLDEDTKEYLGTTYYAEYVEDPISAYMNVDGEILDNSVDVSRTYSESGHIGADWYYYPYKCEVTLTPTGSHTGAPYVKWQVSEDDGLTFSDLDFDDTTRNYSVGLGAALTFTENSVVPEEDYVADKYIYRAIYGTTTSEIIMYCNQDGKLSSNPYVAHYKDTDKGVAYPVGTAMRFAYPIDKSKEVKYKLYSDISMESYIVIEDGDDYSITESSDSVILEFSLSKAHSSTVLVAEYDTPVTATYTLFTSTTSGKGFNAGKDYEATFTSTGDYPILEISVDSTVYSDLGKSQLMMFYDSDVSQWRDITENVKLLKGGYSSGEIVIGLLSPVEYEFIMQDAEINDTTFRCYIDLSGFDNAELGAMTYQLYDPNLKDFGESVHFDTSSTGKQLIVVPSLTKGMKIYRNYSSGGPGKFTTLIINETKYELSDPDVITINKTEFADIAGGAIYSMSIVTD